MLILNWPFAIFWAWVGGILFGVLLLCGAPEPFIGFVLVTLIMIVPLACMDIADRIRGI